MNESVWLSEGIRLYRERLQDKPFDMNAKADLAKLLLRSGNDEKLRYVNLNEAQHLFEEVLTLYPQNAEALYRLGHIWYDIDEYGNSIASFMKVLDKPLSSIRMFRTFSIMSKAYFHLGDDDKALCFFKKAIAMDQERNFTSEIQEIESLITQGGSNKRLVRYADGVSQFVTPVDVVKLKAETVVHEEAVLDLNHEYFTFDGPIGDARLERKEAELLRYLIERKHKMVSMEELLNVWEEDEAPLIKTIRSYISKIRAKLKQCLPEETRKIIETKSGQGYRWVSKIPVTIMKDAL